MRQLITALSRRLIPPTETLDGYQQAELVDVIFRKTLAYNPQQPWPEISDASSVLDFGGGCGLHYKQANSASVRWAVVETPAMVDRARELSTDRLRFFTDISEAANWLGSIDVMYSNGAIQYVPDPELTLSHLCGLRARKMLWHRMWFSDDGIERSIYTSHLADNGPGKIATANKAVRYEFTKMPESLFLKAHFNYMLTEREIDSFLFKIRSILPQ